MSQYHSRKDDRGTLNELFRGDFKQCNLLTMRKGSVWGSHYHKKTAEHFYVLEGKIELKTQDLNNLKTAKHETKMFSKGEGFTIMPYTLHTITVKNTARCMVLYSQEFDGVHPDIYR